MDLHQVKLATIEVELWRQLCRELEAVGAVTLEDLEKSTTDRSTPGTELLHRIRTWGDSLVSLRLGELGIG